MTKPINPPQDTSTPDNDAPQQQHDYESPSYWATVVPESELPSGEILDLNNLNTTQKRVWQEQNRWLAAYTRTRTKTLSAIAAGISRFAVHLWEREDTLGFRRRLEIADALYLDSLEAFANSIAFQTKPGQSPLLLLALLNANLPEKYRPNAVVSDNTAAELLSEIRKLGRKQRPAASSPDSESEGNVTQLRPQRGA